MTDPSGHTPPRDTAPGKTSSRDASVDAWVGQAKEAISKADYSVALELLRKAVAAAPDDTEARQLLAQTEDASRRHQAAVTRYQRVVETARAIETLIDRGEVEAARAQLHAAMRQQGRQDPFVSLDERLTAAEAETRRRRSVELTTSARKLLASGDWQGALIAARDSLSLQPDEDTRQLAAKAQAELDRQAEHQHFQQTSLEAQRDIERLIEARELARAGQRLRQAIDSLGNLPAFDELGTRIDRAKSDASFRQRVEWAERRANEAESLIAEAARCSRRNAFEDAVQRLEAARDLDPSHPNLEQHLETAHAALQQQLAEREHAQAIAHRQSEIRSHLDGLRLDLAAAAIQQASSTFELQHFTAERTRLERLREAERSAPVSQPGFKLDPATETALLHHQRTLAAAYSWKQALLYPFRGSGRIVLWGLFATFLVLDLMAALLVNVPMIGWGLGLLSFGVLLTVLAAIPTVIRTTLDGRNLLPAWTTFGNTRRWLEDLLRFGGLVMLAMLPLGLILLTRGWHGGLHAESGFFGWLVTALVGWLGLAFIITGSGAGIAFGDRQLLRLTQHGRVLMSREIEPLLTINGLFAVGLLITVLQSTVLRSTVMRSDLVPSIAWLGLAIVHLITAYTLILTPHLIGVLVRRHHLELSKLYS